MTWTNSLTPGSHGGAKTGRWPAKGSGNAGRVVVMDRPKQKEDRAEVWLVNRCSCGSAKIRIEDTKRGRPRAECTTRYLRCRGCGRRWTAIEWPR